MLPNLRTDRKNVTEISNNAVHAGDSWKNFEVEVHNRILNTVVESIIQIFMKH